MFKIISITIITKCIAVSRKNIISKKEYHNNKEYNLKKENNLRKNLKFSVINVFRACLLYTSRCV